jgi:outer membrane protein TolC
VLQAQVQYSNSVPDAKKAADGAVLALEMLKNTLGLPMDQDIAITGSPEYKKLEMAYTEIKKRFDSQNDDRDMVQAAANIAGYQRNLAVAMLLPNIALSMNYLYLDGNQDFRLNGQDWTSSWSGTIGFQWTFYDGFKNIANIKEAEAGAEKAEINKQNVNNMLQIQLDQLYTSLEQSAQVIEAADELIKQAEEGYRIAKESYKNGLIQSVDLLNAETGLLKAKTNYLNSMMNYITTVQKLKNFID